MILLVASFKKLLYSSPKSFVDFFGLWKRPLSEYTSTNHYCMLILSIIY